MTEIFCFQLKKTAAKVLVTKISSTSTYLIQIEFLFGHVLARALDQYELLKLFGNLKQLPYSCFVYFVIFVVITFSQLIFIEMF